MIPVNMPTIRSTARAVLGSALLLLAPALAQAQVTYTSFDAFLADAGPLGLDRFDDLAGNAGSIIAGPIGRSAGATVYTVQASGVPLDGLFALANPADVNDGWLSTEDATATLRFTAFGANVSAIGGRFFTTDLDGTVADTPLRVRALDVMGNVVETTLTPASAEVFFGLRFDHALASFELTADNDAFSGRAYFATVNDLVLGGARAVPEPATVWLLSLGLGGVVLRTRRRTSNPR